MATPSMTDFHKFRDLRAELRLMIWREALPEHSTVPVDSIMKGSDSNAICLTQPSTTPPNVVWAIEPLPRGRWPPEFRLRVQAIQSLYDANFEARQEVIRRFPDVLGSEGGEIRFNTTKDLVLLTRSMQLDTLFFHSQVSITYMGQWNTKIHRLAIEHTMLPPFLAGLFAAPNITTGIGFDVVRELVRFLHQFTNLEQLLLVHPRQVSMTAWNNTPEELQMQLLKQLDTSYSSGLEMVPSTKPTAQSLAYMNGAFYAHHATLLTDSVDNLNRVIHGDSEADENWSFNHAIDFGQPRLQHLDIRKMFHLSPELRHLCLHMSEVMDVTGLQALDAANP